MTSQPIVQSADLAFSACGFFCVTAFACCVVIDGVSSSSQFSFGCAEMQQVGFIAPVDAGRLVNSLGKKRGYSACPHWTLVVASKSGRYSGRSMWAQRRGFRPLARRVAQSTCVPSMGGCEPQGRLSLSGERQQPVSEAWPLRLDAEPASRASSHIGPRSAAPRPPDPPTSLGLQSPSASATSATEAGSTE